MRFDLSDEQRALREAARTLLDGGASSERVRKVLGSADGFDRDLWREMATQGWPAVALPEALGGLGLGFVEVAVLAEEIGRHVAPAPFVSTVLALTALSASEHPEAQAWVEPLASGSAIGAVCFHDGLVADGPIADVVVHVGGDRVTAYDTSERRLTGQPAMDQTRTVAWLPALDGGFDIGDSALAEQVLDAAATTYASELLGLAGRMLEVSTEYAKVREQFGRPIGGFQAVKHRLADMLVDVEGMRSATWYAAWALTAGADDTSLAASGAKSWASDAGRRVLSGALQVHGGIGFTWDHDLHLFYKRAQQSSVLWGDGAFHRERIARLLEARLTAGTGVF